MSAIDLETVRFLLTDLKRKCDYALTRIGTDAIYGMSGLVVDLTTCRELLDSVERELGIKKQSVSRETVNNTSR